MNACVKPASRPVVLAPPAYSPRELERAIGRFVEHYNYRRYHESLQNVTPADAYHGRQQMILLRRERIKERIMERGKRANLRAAYPGKRAESVS